MEARERPDLFRRLMIQLARLVRRKPTPHPGRQRHEQTTTLERCVASSLAKMAEEEDYGSMPLPDRFGHKVRDSVHNHGHSSERLQLLLPASKLRC